MDNVNVLNLTTELSSRVMELESICIEIEKISGYKIEQIKDLFLQGYTLMKN